MTQPLSVRLMKATAFNKHAHLGPDGGICQGCALTEFERLQPFLEVLIEASTALEAEKCKCVYKPFSHQYRFMCKRCECLTKLQTLLDAKEG